MRKSVLFTANQFPKVVVVRPDLSVVSWAAVLLMLVAGSGCVRHYPADLGVELRGAVDRESILRITGTYAPREDEAILVDLSSRTDWVARAKEQVASVQLSAGFCDGLLAPKLTTSRLFANGNLVGITLPLESGISRDRTAADATLCRDFSV